MRTGISLLLAGVCCLAGCSSSSVKGTPLLPDKTIRLTSALSVTTESLVSGALVLGAIYLVYDPLAPNWEIEETRLGEETFRLSLRMKRYHTGGSGESIRIVKRRAQALQEELGYGDYQLEEYSEGIDSQTLGARRIAEGTIRLVNRRVISPSLNDRVVQ